MSFGFSAGDFVLLTQLAWRTLQNARQACGEHDELAREVSSLHVVLQRLETEVTKPHSILNSSGDDRMAELATLVGNCERVTNLLLKILEKYNALSEDKKRVTKLWKRVQFGNGEMRDLSAIRLHLSAHTNAITLFLNLLAIGSQGNVEQHITAQGGELRKIGGDINWIIATLQAGSNREGSILTSYTDDDKSFWKELRRELVKEGYSSKVLKKHKTVIKNYVHELGAIGALDALPQEEPECSLEITPETDFPPEAKISHGSSGSENTEEAAKIAIAEAKVKEANVHEIAVAEAKRHRGLAKESIVDSSVQSTGGTDSRSPANSFALEYMRRVRRNQRSLQKINSPKVLKSPKEATGNYLDGRGAAVSMDELSQDELAPNLDHISESDAVLELLKVERTKKVAKEVIVTEMAEVEDIFKEGISVNRHRREDAGFSSANLETGTEEIDQIGEDKGQDTLKQTPSEEYKHIKSYRPTPVRSSNLYSLRFQSLRPPRSPQPLQAPQLTGEEKSESRVYGPPIVLSSILQTIEDRRHSGSWMARKIVPKQWGFGDSHFVLFGTYTFFNIESLGKWIYDWTVWEYGKASVEATKAYSLMTYLVQSSKTTQRALESMRWTGDMHERKIFKKFLDSGSDLWAQVKRLFRTCETYATDALREEKRLVNYGKLFVLALFDKFIQLERTQRLLGDMRVWLNNFDSTGGVSLSNPIV